MSDFHCLHDSTDGFNSTFDDISFYEKIGNAFCIISENESSKRLSSVDNEIKEQGILESFESVLKKPKLTLQEHNNYFQSDQFNVEDYGATKFNSEFLPKEWIENEITGVYYQVSNMEVEEVCTSIKEEKEINDLDQFNYNNIYTKNENPNNYYQPEQENNHQMEEERFWEDEVNTLFSQDVKYQQIDEVLIETSLTDSIDSSTYNFVHSWCTWLDLENEDFDDEEESLLKRIKKDYILEEQVSGDLREINRMALESKQNEVNSIPSTAWESDHEDDATGRKRDRECDKISLKYNRPWRRRELNKQGDDKPISDSPPIYPAVMKAYTVSGQCHTIDLMKYRPTTFQNQGAMRMWDHAIKVNSSKLVQTIEESSFFPSELDRKAELQFLNDIKNVTHEATKLARFFEKTHSDIIGLIYREELIILYNYLIVFEDKMNCQHGSLAITRQFVNIFFNKLSLIRQHIIVDTIYQMLVAALEGQNLSLDVFILLNWLEKEIFNCSENKNIFEVFSNEKEKFESYVENLSFSQIMTLTALPERKLNEFGLKASYQKLEITQAYVPNIC